MSNPIRTTRRRLLAAGVAAGVAGIAGCSGSQSGAASNDTTAGGSDDPASPAGPAVEAVVSVPGEEQPENLAVADDGDLYFGLKNGELRRVPRDRLGDELAVADTELVATLPETTGVAVVDDGTVYVAVPTEDERGGLWEVPPEGEATQLATIGEFPNGVFADGDRLLVTESFQGRVFEIAPDGSKSIWLADDRLDPAGLGANGITRSAAGEVYVAVTEATDDTGRLLRVPVADDGSAGEPTVAQEGSDLYGADGVTSHEGSRYLAVNHRQQVLELPDGGASTTVATAEDGLVYPSDVVVGHNGTHLYICDLAVGSPADAGIYRTEL